MKTRYHRGIGCVNTLDDWWTLHGQDVSEAGPYRGRGYIKSIRGTYTDAKRAVDQLHEATE